MKNKPPRYRTRPAGWRCSSATRTPSACPIAARETLLTEMTAMTGGHELGCFASSPSHVRQACSKDRISCRRTQADGDGDPGLLHLGTNQQ
ncbi:hypothetical protein I7I50_07730 [Histoplasma capsulatum G186AR]|uniref:Uncharacterized protein n=1 Tax=Ajellomyces capsulatus TaxID=5037 RepID=A0A8H7YXI2_AJECA|nr:hypothetical protein I7I52_09197 [Histoplasma capsulatum]QSS68349.1 hypothetical protein I7I50_07730 [Histoplasma capsulatum G186AR]